MKYLGGRLANEGFPVSIPRLPGHGTNHEDFLSVSWRDWMRRCVDEYLELSSNYDRVFVAGLSMGGLLTALVAAQFHPERIALAAPAFAANNPLIGLTPFLRWFVTSATAPIKSYDGRMNDEERYLEDEYRRRSWVGPIAELRALQKIAAARLHLIDSQTLTIISKGDHTVPAKVADLIESRIRSSQKKRVVLETSPHVVVNDVEKERVADEIIEWFRR